MTDPERCAEMFRLAGKPNLRKGQGRPPTPCSWFARALGLNRGTVTQWGDDWPTYAKRHLDWLRKVHPEDWPKEWRL